MKLSLIIDFIILYVAEPKDSINLLLELTRDLGRVAACRINEHKSTAQVYTKSTAAEKEIANMVPFKIVEKDLN